MRNDKDKAYALRKNGYTYSFISKELNIPKGTLSDWFQHHPWSEEIKEKNSKISAIKNIQILNEKAGAELKEKYKKVEKEAEREFEIYKNNPIFMGGLMLYAGEGDKTSKHHIRLSNSEFYLHTAFLRFSEQFLNIGRDNIKFWLLLYPDHEIESCIDIWSKKLKINKSNFYKSQVIQGKSKLRKLQYGVGNSIISNTSLKKKMLKWLELCKLHFN
ncbi:MAG: hypothetical protein AAB334_01115 [Patescibacteria group bacterium]